MTSKKEYIQSKFELFVDSKYIIESLGEYLNEEQITKLENEIQNAFTNVQVNMGDNFVPFMDNLFEKLHSENCYLGEKEIGTREEFNICMNNMKLFGAELIDTMF